MPNVTLEQKLKSQNVPEQDMADLQPLLANQAFRQNAEQQIAQADSASQAQAAARGMTGEYEAEVNVFLTAVQSLNTIGKKFPEVAKEVAAAKAALSEAMGKVRFGGLAAAQVMEPELQKPAKAA